MKSSTKKPIFLTLLTSILLTACHGGGTAPTSSATPKLSFKNSLPDYSISFGSPAVSADSTTFVIPTGGTCVNIPEDTPITLDAGTSEFKYNKNMTTSEILDILGVNGSLKGTISSVSGDFKAEYEKANTQSQLDYRVTYYAKEERPVNIPALKLSPNAPSLTNCGDGFVSGGIGGIYYTASIIIHFTNVADKMKLLADGYLNSKDLGDLAAKLTMAKENTGVDFDVKLEIVQRGGDPQEIFSTFDDLKNIGLENEAKTFYLAELSPENMKMAGNIVQKYISEKLKPQMDNLANAKELSVARAQLFITNPKKTAYSDTQEHYTRPDSLNRIITTLETRFANLSTFKNDFAKYVSFVDNFKYLPNAIAPVANSEKNWKSILELQDQILARSKSCFSYLPTEEEIANCETNLRSLSDEVTSVEKTINDDKWGYGYPINIRTGVVTEGLLPIAENLENGTTTLISVANAPLNTYYFPGTEYQYDSQAQTITLSGPIAFPSEESEIIANRTLKYSGVKLSDNALSATKVEYADLDSGFELYTTTNYPGSPSESTAKKMSRMASKSSTKSNLFLPR